MTIGWSFIENFENDSQPYKNNLEMFQSKKLLQMKNSNYI